MNNLSNTVSDHHSDPTIEVIDVCKSFRVYNDKSHTLKDRVLSHERNRYTLNHVLDHISFHVHHGEALGLIGHNGCGKSTTLKLLNRILYPDSGEIRMHGKISSLIELGAGFHPDMTGRENIYINATIFGLKKKEIDKRLDDIIRFSELEEYIDNPVRTYSSGMYMRLAFSIAINVDADILLIDEILAVGDANFQKKCFDKLQEIKNDGTTIVIVSHSMDQIRSICNRVIWLENGKIKEDGIPQKVCPDYMVAMDERAVTRQKKELEESGDKALSEIISKYPPSRVNQNCSKNANRFGNMSTRYEQIQLCTADLRENTTFHLSERMILKGSLASELPDAAVNLIIKIFNRFGGHASTLESKWLKDEFIPVSDRLNFQLTLDDIHLLPGDYYIECAIRNQKGELTDNLTHFLSFSIVPKYNDERDNLGVVYIDNKWSFS